MVSVNVFGTECYIQVQPTFTGGKGFILKRKPKGLGTDAQMKARARLGVTMAGLGGKKIYGTVTYNGKQVPRIAAELARQMAKNKWTGEGACGGMSREDRLKLHREYNVHRVEDLRQYL